jgi:hypothetical protein
MPSPTSRRPVAPPSQPPAAAAETRHRPSPRSPAAPSASAQPWQPLWQPPKTEAEAIDHGLGHGPGKGLQVASGLNGVGVGFGQVVAPGAWRKEASPPMGAAA